LIARFDIIISPRHGRRHGRRHGYTQSEIIMIPQKKKYTIRQKKKVYLSIYLFPDSYFHLPPRGILLAGPGALISTLVTGCLIRGMFSNPFPDEGSESPLIDKDETSWPWASAFLLGSILAATDPVAVIAALNALHAPAKLTLLVSGEALLNDGAGVVLFEMFFEIASGKHTFDFAVFYNQIFNNSEHEIRNCMCEMYNLCTFHIFTRNFYAL
jgi:hypothetical protein